MPVHNEMRGRKDGNPTRDVQKGRIREPEDPGYPWHKVYRDVKPKSGLKPLPAPSKTPDPHHPNIDQIIAAHNAANEETQAA